MSSFPRRIQFESTVVQLRSHDVDEINQLLRRSNWQPNLVQLGAGLLEHQYLIANLGGIQFARVTTNLPMLHRSGSPHHTISFALPFNRESTYTWCGYALSARQIIVHQANREVDLAGSDSSDLAVITLDVDDFLSSGLPEDEALFKQVLAQKTHVLLASQMTVLRLKHYLQELFTMAQNQPNKATHPVMQTIIRNDFLPLLLECLATTQPVPESGSLNRYQLVKQAEAYILTHLDQPLTLQDLCAAAGTKCRTLQTAFLQVCGISPMTYLKIQRLHGARAQLQAADPKTATVMAVANRWGFWHMGYFSRDYKRMFGELPSQALRQV